MFLGLSVYAQEDKIYKSLDDALKSSNEVIYLDLYNQGLTKISKNINKMENLKSINLSNNKLSSLPSFASFSHLEWVNLSNNKLENLPSFLKITGGERNLIIDNNPGFKIAVSGTNERNVTESGFEGTMRLASSSTIVAETKGKSTFLKIMPYGATSETWIEIHKKDGMTNNALLEKIKNDSQLAFNYFVNKHSTYDKSIDSLPPFLQYNCSINPKKGIVSNNVIVFFEMYYITLATSKKFIGEGDLKQMLQYALTYQPKSKDNFQVEVVNGINFSKDEFKTNTAEDFLAKAVIPEKVKVSSVLPVLTPVKETIYTLQPGETVAFTDEYKMGITLKNDDYYIYYKKAEKYYVKTNKKVFGPYDNIPENQFGNYGSKDIIALKVTRDKTDFFIFNGEEYGPYSEGASFWVESKDDGSITTTLSYNLDNSTYYEIDGRKYGPYPLNSSLDILKGKEVVLSESDNGMHELIIDGEVKLKDFKLLEYYGPISDDHIGFMYSKDGKEYALFDDRIYGPYDDVLDLGVVDGQLRMRYRNNNDEYMLIDGKTFGPYDEFIKKYGNFYHNYFTYKNDGKYYTSNDGIVNGPYDKEPYDNVFYDDEHNNHFYYLEFTKRGQEYFLFKGKNYGPFEDVLRVYTDYLQEVFSMEDKQPFAMVKNTDGTFSVFTPEQNYLSFKKKPYVYYSDSLKKIAFSFTETNREGREEYYLWMEDNKYGPFQRIIHISYSSNSYREFNRYDFILTTLSGKKIIVNEDGIWGAFDKLEIENLAIPDQVSAQYGKCKIGDQWFIFDEQKLVGPILNLPPDDPKDYEDESKYFWRDGENVISKIKAEGPGYKINDQLTVNDYCYSVASNDKNYMMITRNDAYKVNGYIINNKFTKSNDIFYRNWEKETKTLYWLTLEGKNIVKYKLKL